MELILRSRPTVASTTFGQIFVDGVFECQTLEDAVREIQGVPVAQWKIKDATAIPAGRYRVVLEDSPKFGPDTMTLVDVPGFDHIRIHSGVDKDSTEGCICVGDRIDSVAMTISGGLARGVLKRLKAKVQAAIAANDPVWITIERAA